MIRVHAVTVFVLFGLGVAAAGEGPAAADPATKHPIPSAEDQKKAIEILDEVFELGKKRTDRETIDLAGKAYKMADEVKGRPAERFALLRKAMELASDGGDVALMVEIINVIGAEFQIDALVVEGKMLNAFANNVKDTERIKSLVGAAKNYVSRAVAAEKFDYALNIATLANRVSQRGADTNLRKEAFRLRQEVERLRREHEQLWAARKTLEADPDDPGANLAVGSAICFSRGNWKDGLRHLSRGSDSELAALAKREIGAPKGPVDQARLADGWWTVAQTRKGQQKKALLLHAGDWYTKAEPTATGLTRVKVEKRLAEMAKWMQSEGMQPRAPSVTAATIYWLMADDMDIYQNGKPLREYKPSFRTRPDEARKKSAYSAKISLRPGDVFTVGGRRGGSYGGTVVVADGKNKLVWCSNTNDWRVYEPADPERWYLPEVAMRSKQGPVRVANSYGYQAQMRRDYGDKPQPIWGNPSQRVVYMVGVYGQPKPGAKPTRRPGHSNRRTR